MIITIGRQHGSNGHNVARTLSDRLLIPCYSKEIVERTAKSAHLSRDVIRTYDEKPVSPLFGIGLDLPFFGAGEVFQLNMQIAQAQFDTIRELADGGDSIFVGRCADYILRDRSDLLRVFLTADLPFRVQELAQRYQISEDEARKRIKEVDKDRANYYNYYTDRTWSDVSCYDLCLNVGRLGVDACVNVIVDCLDALGLKTKS